MDSIDNKNLFENNENQTPETEETVVNEDVITDVSNVNEETMSIVSAKDSGLDQTVSAVSSDSAIFDVNVKDFNVECSSWDTKDRTVVKKFRKFL